MNAPVTDRPVMATKALVRQILEQHPEGLTDDRLWALTGLPGSLRGSVRRRRKDTGAVEVGKGKSDLNATCAVWALPGGES